MGSGALRPSTLIDWIPDPFRDGGRGGLASLDGGLTRSEEEVVMGVKLAVSVKPDPVPAGVAVPPISTLVSPSSGSLLAP